MKAMTSGGLMAYDLLLILRRKNEAHVVLGSFDHLLGPLSGEHSGESEGSWEMRASLRC